MNKDKKQYNSLQALSDRIKDSNDAMRNHLIRRLLQEKDNRRFVNELLENGNGNLRHAILRLLAPQNVVEILPTLENILQEDDLVSQKIIIRKLGSMPDAETEKVLLKFLKIKSPKNLMLKMTIAALGNAGGSASVKAIANGFEKYNADIKIAALIALNKIGREEAIPVYLKALHSTSAPVRLWAMKSLKPFYYRISREEMIKIVREEKSVQNKAYAVRMLGKYDDDFIRNFLVSLLSEPDSVSVKYEILNTLKKFPFFETKKIFQKQNKQGHIEKQLMENALDYLQKKEDIQKDVHLICRRWVNSPMSYPDASILIFFMNNQGAYEEEKAGEVIIQLSFGFELEGNRLLFSIGDEKKTVSFSISTEPYNHPYEGKMRYLVLTFHGPDVYIGDINITGSSYYHLIEDI